eukprot:scaffold1112_cov116-Isochrysis_galbana.AAC.11
MDRVCGALCRSACRTVSSRPGGAEMRDAGACSSSASRVSSRSAMARFDSERSPSKDASRDRSVDRIIATEAASASCVSPAVQRRSAAARSASTRPIPHDSSSAGGARRSAFCIACAQSRAAADGCPGVDSSAARHSISRPPRPGGGRQDPQPGRSGSARPCCRRGPSQGAPVNCAAEQSCASQTWGCPRGVVSRMGGRRQVPRPRRGIEVYDEAP